MLYLDAFLLYLGFGAILGKNYVISILCFGFVLLDILKRIKPIEPDFKDPALDRVRYVVVTFYDQYNNTTFTAKWDADLTKYPDRYQYYIDSCFIANPMYEKQSVALYDRDGFEIPLIKYYTSWHESSYGENDGIGFFSVYPIR